VRLMRLNLLMFAVNAARGQTVVPRSVRRVEPQPANFRLPKSTPRETNSA
jgi:hypothetical protein